MIVKRKVCNGFSRWLNNQRGVAEIVGSIMFLLILLFFFTNVYLWHDTATRQMDDVLANKLNSPISIRGANGDLIVTNDGGVGVSLSRLWIIDSSEHVYASLENVGENGLWVDAGGSVKLDLLDQGTQNVNEPDGSISVILISQDECLVQYSPGGSEIFKALTVSGNMASCSYVPPPSP